MRDAKQSERELKKADGNRKGEREERDGGNRSNEKGEER
jgi:hypothetical protein